MQRYVLLVLFAVLLVVPFLLSYSLRRQDAAPAAVSGPQVSLTVITPHNADIRNEFERAFDRWHRERFGQSVDVVYLTPGGTLDIKRQLETTYRAHTVEGSLDPNFRPDIHIVWGGGDFFFNSELKPLKVLQPLQVSPTVIAEAFPEQSLAGVRLHDGGKDLSAEPPHWVGVCLSSFGIVYNPALTAALGMHEPQTWRDLADPRLAGLVALANPGSSGSASVGYMMVLQRHMADAEEAFLAAHPELAARGKAEYAKDPAYQKAIAQGWHDGMSTLVRIAANARYFTDSATQVPNDVGLGDAAAGVAIDFYGRVFQETLGSDRVRFVSPRASTAITPDPVAVLAGVDGEKRELANRFVEFLLTEQAQLLWIKKGGTPGGPTERALRRPPIRQSVYAADRSDWTDQANPFEFAGGFNQRGEWMATFTDVRLIWAAAWIDARDALKSAYAEVLAVDDETRRADLIRRLSDLPITLDDVVALNADRKRREREKDDVDFWKAQTRIAWATTFRQHYQTVAREARTASVAGAR